MTTTRLLFLVEGDADERFVEHVVKPLVADTFDQVGVWQYAQRKKDKTRSFIRGLGEVGASYLYLHDLDGEPCATGRKTKVLEHLPSVDPNSIVVVCQAIESWYLAGLLDEDRRRLRVAPFGTTDSVTTAQFESGRPEKLERTEYMMELVRRFSVEVARTKNRSFAYLLSKLDNLRNAVIGKK